MSAEVTLLRPGQGYFREDPLRCFLLYAESSNSDIFEHLNEFGSTIGVMTVISPSSDRVEWVAVSFTSISILVHVSEPSNAFIDFLRACSKFSVARNSCDEKRLNEAFGIHIKQSEYASKIRGFIELAENRPAEFIPVPKMIENAVSYQVLHETLHIPFVECLLEYRLRTGDFDIPDDVYEIDEEDLIFLNIPNEKHRLAIHKKFYVLFFVRKSRAKELLLKTNHRGILRGIIVRGANDNYSLAYKYCPDFVSHETTLNDYQRLKVCIDIAFMIDSLHNNGYTIGQDAISEDNIYLDVDGNAKLCDIGVATKAKDRNTFYVEVSKDVEQFCLMKNRILKITATKENILVMGIVIYELIERCFVDVSQALQIQKDIEYHLKRREEMEKKYLEITIADAKAHLRSKSKSLIDLSRDGNRIEQFLYTVMYEDPETGIDFLELCVKSSIGSNTEQTIRLVNMLDVIFVNPKLQSEYVMTKALSIIEQYIQDPQDAPKLYCHIGKAYIHGKHGKHRIHEGVQLLRVLASYGVTDALIALSSFMRARKEFEEAKSLAATAICCGEGAAGYFELGMNHKDKDSPFYDDEKAIEAFNSATEMGHMESELEILMLCESAVPDRITSLARIARESNYSAYGPLIDVCIEEEQLELGRECLRDLKAIVTLCELLDKVKWKHVYCPDKWNLRKLRDILTENLHGKHKRWRALNA